MNLIQVYMQTKVCSKCGNVYPITSFYKDKTHKDGHSSECKHCKHNYIMNRKTLKSVNTHIHKSITQCSDKVNQSLESTSIHRSHNVHKVDPHDKEPNYKNVDLNIIRCVVNDERPLHEQILYHESCIEVLKHLSKILSS
jgi:hypothetical protein